MRKSSRNLNKLEKSWTSLIRSWITFWKCNWPLPIANSAGFLNWPKKTIFLSKVSTLNFSFEQFVALWQVVQLNLTEFAFSLSFSAYADLKTVIASEEIDNHLRANRDPLSFKAEDMSPLTYYMRTVMRKHKLIMSKFNFRIVTMKLIGRPMIGPPRLELLESYV